jgi:hypothetical protein
MVEMAGDGTAGHAGGWFPTDGAGHVYQAGTGATVLNSGLAGSFRVIPSAENA